MLLNSLYTLSSFGFSEGREAFSATIRLQKDHPVFKGHFPGNPILPGACTVQIIRELLEKVTGRELRLSKAGNIKYLGFINPVTTPEVQLACTIKVPDTGSVVCSATVSANGIHLCSFKGEFVGL
jgi:3-hydroxyacyl-[acyl-carrier-protein] dehydratase